MKRIIGFLSLVFTLTLGGVTLNYAKAGPTNEVQTLNGIWLSDSTNGFTCTSSEVIGSDNVTLYLDSYETVGYWIEFAASEDEGLISFDLTSITLAKYDDSVSQKLSFTLTATRSDMSTETASFIWDADDGSSKVFPLSMIGINKFRIEVTEEFDAFNLEYREFTIDNPVNGNNPPVISNFTSTHFLENTVNDIPQQIAPNITLTDIDSSDFEGGYIIASYNGVGFAEDQLSIITLGNISLSGSDVLYAPIGAIGTVSGGTDGSDLIITLNALATPSRVTELLRAIAYRNISDEPKSYRTVTITVNDGDGGTSLPALAQISIEGEYDSGVEFTQMLQDTNTAWLMDLNNGFTVSAIEGVTVQSDQNSIYMTSIGPSGTINIKADEQLTGNIFDLLSIGIITSNYLSNTFEVEITGYKSNGDLVVASITGITSEDFDAIDLSAFNEITAFDFKVSRIFGTEGIETIRLASFTIGNPKLYSGNISPQIINFSDVTFMENTVNDSYIPIDPDITLIDNDSTDLDGGTIIVSYQGPVLSEDQLWVSNIGSITISGGIVYHSFEGEIASISGGNNGSNLVINMNTKTTPGIATELLRAISYKNTSDEPTTYRTIIIQVTDGDGGTSVPVSAKVTVKGQAESGVDIPGLTQDLDKNWILDLNNGFSYVVTKGVLSGDNFMIWFINDDLGTITFSSDEQFYGGMFDLVSIEFDMPALSTDSFTVIVDGHTKYGTTVTSSISGVSEAVLNSIDLSNLKDIISFDITITGSRRILNVGIVSFTIENPMISNNAPVFVSQDTFSISELAVADDTVLLNVDAHNGEDGGNDEEITYSITGGTALGLFSISSTGEITLNETGAFSLDYEAINSYTIIVSADDGKIVNNITQQVITINVLNEDDEAPVITSLGGGDIAVISIYENSTEVTTVTASDIDTIGDLLYTVAGGFDASCFSITAEGILSFVNAPDYEVQKYYQVIVEVSDGVRKDSQAIEVQILDVNEHAPIIISNDGEDEVDISVNENTLAVTTVMAIDGDTEDIITYGITGGDDYDSFAINSSTGELTFVDPPDYETKKEYYVIVKASDGMHEDVQNIKVKIINVDEIAPVITSDKGGDYAYISVYENTTAVTTITATDDELLGTLTYSISGGSDRTAFQVDAVSGELSFIAAPDYEIKTEYEVVVEVSDGVNSDSQMIYIIILNVNDNCPVITSDGGGASANIAVEENTVAVTTVTGADLDELEELSYYIKGGTDASSFIIDSLTGVLMFIEAPDYETKNFYEVIVAVTDGTFHNSQILNIDVINRNDNAPVITSYDGKKDVHIFKEENQRIITEIRATDVDELDAIRYSVSGVDANEVSIDPITGLLTFNTPADYERKKLYEVIIIASDGKYSDKLILHIVILDIDESIGITVTEDKEGDLTFWSDQNLILDAKTLRELLNGDKDITIAIKDQDGREIYKWIFEKDNLLSSAHNITDIDLTLSVSQIPDNDEIWGRLGEDEGAKGLVLSFGHDGILPAQATIKIYVGDQEGIIPGDKIYLYHYNHESGKLETLPYSSKLIVDQEGYLTITILHCSDYIALHKEADNKKITSLRNQISITPHKRTIYLEYNTTPVRIQVNLPVTLELVESLDDKTSQPMIGGVTVTYSSGNHQVASIDNKGKITIIGAGKAEITARITLYSGKTKEFTTVITVKEPHIKITLQKNKMKVGEVFTFKAQAYGLDSEDITWTTSAKSIIVINKKTGRAVAKSKGTDYVIAAIGDKRDKVKVTVK